MGQQSNLAMNMCYFSREARNDPEGNSEACRAALATLAWGRGFLLSYRGQGHLLHVSRPGRCGCPPGPGGGCGGTATLLGSEGRVTPVGTEDRGWSQRGLALSLKSKWNLFCFSICLRPKTPFQFLPPRMSTQWLSHLLYFGSR